MHKNGDISNHVEKGTNPINLEQCESIPVLNKCHHRISNIFLRIFQKINTMIKYLRYFIIFIIFI